MADNPEGSRRYYPNMYCCDTDGIGWWAFGSAGLWREKAIGPLAHYRICRLFSFHSSAGFANFCICWSTLCWLSLVTVFCGRYSFFLNNSAYYGEIFRAGIVSVGFGQTEAARSTGLSYAQTLLYVVLPQAVRNVLPDLLSNTIEVIKLTSLASVVSLAEILYSAEMARSVTYNASPLVLAAGVYLVFLWPLVRLVSRFGRVLGHD